MGKKEETKTEVVNHVPKKDKMALVPKQKFNVESLIETAVKQGANIDTIERILAVRKDLKAERAEELFNQAMAKFQSKCPVIKKTKIVMNKDGKTVRYRYAPLDSIVKQVRNIISGCGLSYTINAIVDEKFVKAICRVVHAEGHSQESEFLSPVDKDSYMTEPQKFASALTFAKRYAFCNAFGIMTGDEDDDSIANGTKSSDKEKPANINDVKKMVESAIKEAKTSGAVIEIDEKTQKSRKFDKKFKTKIHNLANRRVDELDAK